MACTSTYLGSLPWCVRFFDTKHYHSSSATCNCMVIPYNCFLHNFSLVSQDPSSACKVPALVIDNKPYSSCAFHPDCSIAYNSEDSACLEISISDNTHSKLLASEESDRFVVKLNTHLKDLGLQVSLLRQKPKFHVYGENKQLILPTLLELTTVREISEAKNSVAFLYPEYEQETSKAQSVVQNSSQGHCKCHNHEQRLSLFSQKYKISKTRSQISAES